MTTTTTRPPRSAMRREDTWDLEAIYASDADWERDFATVTAQLPALARFAGHLGEGAPVLLQALQLRDETYRLLDQLFVYAHLRLHEDTTRGPSQALAARATTLSNDVRSASAFLRPEILAIPEARLREWLAADPALAVYRHELEEILREKPHVLTAEMEALLAQAAELGDAPARIYEMLNYADLKLPVVHDERGELVQLTQDNFVQRFLESPNREVRREAFTAMMSTFQGLHNTIGAALAAQVKRDLFFARARHYATSLEAALAPHNIPTSVYDTLVNTVNANLPVLQRYLRLRQRILGLDELHMYDLYVPMVAEVDVEVPYAQAREMVARALVPLGERYVAGIQEGFAQRWIDVYENEGKRSGAYSWGSYSTHPFVLLNYQPKLNSVFTLAHELGHSMHSYFTWKTQPYVYGGYTIFLAEVASTLNEALLTHDLLQRTTDPALRRYILNHHLETFRTTLFRQTLFAEFERDIHTRAEAGEALTPDLLSTVYKGLCERYYGASVTVDDSIAIEWARIPHFYTSYYVYQYATGISASAALAQQIISEGQPAVDRYLRFLSRGSSDYSITLLREAGVDMSSPAPIQQALDTFGRYLDEFERLL